MGISCNWRPARGGGGIDIPLAAPRAEDHHQAREMVPAWVLCIFRKESTNLRKEMHVNEKT